MAGERGANDLFEYIRQFILSPGMGYGYVFTNAMLIMAAVMLLRDFPKNKKGIAQFFIEYLVCCASYILLDSLLELVFISKTWYNSSMKEVRAGRKPYPTDLTDSQWEEIEPLYSGMRNRKWSKRELTNAVLYIVKTGCQWRQLPHDFPPYQTVYSFFSRGAKSGLWEKILAHLVEKTRKDAGKSAEPHYALIDSQSVKTVADNEARGIDGGKKQKGANGMPS